MLKLFIDLNGDAMEFNEDYTKFRRLTPYEHQTGITFRVDFYKQDEIEIDYSFLPENNLKNIPKKEWDKVIIKDSFNNQNEEIL